MRWFNRLSIAHWLGLLVWPLAICLNFALAQSIGPGGGGGGGGGSGTVTNVTITAGTNVTSSGTCNSTSSISCTLNAAGNVTGPGSSTSGDLASFNGAGGQTIQDSGIPAAQITPPPLPAAGNQTQLYNIWGAFANAALANSATAPTQNTARCTPFYVTTAQHWDELSIFVATLGTGPLNVALYTDAIDATTKIHQPQTPITNGSGAFTVTSGNTEENLSLGTAGVGIPIPAGLNWACFNDTTSADAVRPIILSGSSIVGALVGIPSSAPINIAGSPQASALTISETAGTWPSFAGSTFTYVNSSITPNMFARVVSVP